MQVYMMMLQKYQFELRDCSHIFSCHKEVEISLAKKYKNFKFIVATAADYTSHPYLGHKQGGSITIATDTSHITKQRAPIRVATGERHHPIVATTTRPACQRNNVATESSKFCPTSLSEMKADYVKIFTILKQQESTLKERTIPTLLKSIGVGIILSFTVSLF
jgi:hypothetical protein